MIEQQKKYYAEKIGREEGMKQGRRDERIEIAKKIRKEGINIETIMKITGLTKEEVEIL